jgi:hypothetical protein
MACKGGDGQRITVAQVVVVEMGYCDNQHMSGTEAKEIFCKQKWFQTLKAGVNVVKKIVFVRQPSYQQSAGAGSTGQLIEGPGKLLDHAADLVRTELAIESCVFYYPAEDFFAGLILKEDGLWQDPSACPVSLWGGLSACGVDYTAEGHIAAWYDAEHPSKEGAEVHLRRLIVALKEFLMPA